MTSTPKRALLIAAIVLGLAGASSGVAMAGPQRVALSLFQGPGADQLRAAVIARLPRGLHVLPPEQADRADAVVEGQIWTGKVWTVCLVVRNSRTGATAGTLVWSGTQPRALIQEVLREAPPKLEARVKALVRQRLAAASRTRSSSTARRQVRSAGSGVNAGSTVPEHGPTESENAGDSEGDAQTPIARTEHRRRGIPARAPADAAGPLLEVSVGAGSIGRTLTFADNRAAAPGYSLPAASTLGGELAVFPGARVGGWLGTGGLAGAWETSIAAQTAGRDGQQSHPTRHQTFSLGARGRLPFGRATLLGGLDLGQQRFEVDLPGATLSPSVRYRFLRPSLGGRLALDDFALSLSAAYLRVLSGSGLAGGSVFPRAEVRGFELGARLAYAIAPELAADLRLDFRRFAHDMNARPGDAMLVGGAVDDYLAAALRLTYRVW